MIIFFKFGLQLRFLKGVLITVFNRKLLVAFVKRNNVFIPCLINEIGNLVTTDMEKAEVPSNFFCLSFHCQLLVPHLSSP